MASSNTNCLIWELNKTTIRIQLIEYQKEVNDIEFSQSDEDIFISIGDDGSMGCLINLHYITQLFFMRQKIIVPLQKYHRA